jgi:hypothetical protein
MEALAVASVRDMIADSAVFQARLALHGPSISEELERIYLYEADAQVLSVGSLRDLRPFIVIGISEDNEYRPASSACAVQHLINTAGVYVVIQDNARYTDPDEDDQGDPYLDFLNFAGGVCGDMSGKFFGPLDRVGFRSIETVEPLARTGPKERESDDYFSVMFKFVYAGVE